MIHVNTDRKQDNDFFYSVNFFFVQLKVYQRY